jgi:peroxisomal 2,4-dienoyl-CoA reductase
MDIPFPFRNDVLKGKVALVTGGASGIGLGIAHRLAAAGADLALASRRSELCEEKAAELAKQYGVRAIGLALNVRDSEAVAGTMAQVAEKLGSLDILINNAAGNFYYASNRLSDNQWKSVLEIDLYGTFFCSRAAFEHMKGKGGLIVSISMTLHHQGWVGMAPACAAKAGIDALTMTLAQEWGHHGIRVNAIAPGPIITEGVQKAFSMGGDFEDFKDTIPLGRAGEPEDIGDLAVYMACAPWMTGSIVTLDGGERLSARRGGVAPTAIEPLTEMLMAARDKGA